MSVILVLSLSRLPGDGAIVVPDSNCYVVNNDSRLIDYVSLWKKTFFLFSFPLFTDLSLFLSFDFADELDWTPV